MQKLTSKQQVSGARLYIISFNMCRKQKSSFQRAKIAGKSFLGKSAIKTHYYNQAALYI